MSKYIDADKLIAKIEKRKRKLNVESPFGVGGIIELELVLDTITSLQQEQPSLPSNLNEATEDIKKISISIDDLNLAVTSAVNAAMESHDKKQKTTLISRKKTALRLQVNPSTLWRWARVGFLQPVKIAGKLYYYEEDIERLEHGEMEA